ncbi:MAG: hypothetical protein AB7N61_21175 [Acidimicrobiia bacterium]
MRTRPRVAVIGAAVALWVLKPTTALAQDVTQCVEWSPRGYCIEWDVPTPGTPGTPGDSGGGPPPECYWVNLSDDLGADDPTIYADFGLERPPEGVDVIWQSWECADGRTTFNFRWVIAATPGTLASIARGRLVGELPQPVVETSPAAGTASIIGVPVFVAVVNWTGVVTETECAGGLCVTVTATPQLTFRPGEPGAQSVQCAGAGTRFAADVGTPESQASSPGACTWTYTTRTGANGRPSAWPGQASVSWSVAWTATTGASGSLAAVTRSTDVPRPVAEVQTVIEGGATP